MSPKPNGNAQYEKLLRIQRARLYPSLTDPNFLVLRARRLNFTKWISQLPRHGLNILDVGGRYQPYRELLQSRTARYVGVDIHRTEMVDVIATGECLPFAENTFDVVIATQVFDYFAKPHLAADQIHAVLKPGGCLFMSAPAFAPPFADAELWRFTPAGIRSTLSPFRTVEIVAEAFSPGGLIRAANLGFLSLLKLKFLRRLVEVSAVPLSNLLGMSVERCGLTTNDQFTPNYSVLAIK